MRTNFTSTDDSAVLRLTFDPVDGPEAEGHVTVPATHGTLTIDGTGYTGISGACTLPADQSAHPGNTSIPYIGTFTLVIAAENMTALSGVVIGSFDAEKIFRPHRFTEVMLDASLGDSDSRLTFLPPPSDEEDIAMGTASVIIKPN